MARQEITGGNGVSGQLGGSIKDIINENFIELYTNSLQLGDSEIYPEYLSYQATAQNTSGNGQEVLEFLNLGNPHANSEDRNLVPGGVYRATGSVIVSRNTKFNQADQRWEYVLSTASAYGACWIELGGEGVNFMAAPVGTHPYSLETGGINFSIRGAGLRSVTGYTSGYVNQTMAPIIGVYESSASGLGQWNPSTSAEPIFGAMSEEAKGTDNEYYKAETNSNSTSAWPAYYFLKSRGTYGTKTAVAADDIIGRIGWKAYDGNSYEITAVIEGVAKGTIGDGNAGQSIRLRTSATNTAGLATQIEVMDGGQIGFYGVTPVSRQVVATGSTTDQVITALQNLGLFSQS